MTESINNKTFVPLKEGHIYIGKFDDVKAYGSCVMSVYSDTDVQIGFYQSQDRLSTYSTLVSVPANSRYIRTFYLSAPYCYFTVRNSGVADQGVLQFTIMYKVEGEAPSIQKTTQDIVGESIVNLSNQRNTTLSCYGSATGTIKVQFSQDGNTFYDSQYTVALGGTEIDFGFTFQTSAPYIQIISEGGTISEGYVSF